VNVDGDCNSDPGEKLPGRSSHTISLRAWLSKTRRLLQIGWICLALLSGGCTSLGEFVHNGLKVGPNYTVPVR
jgi:hypothetical protein